MNKPCSMKRLFCLLLVLGIVFQPLNGLKLIQSSAKDKEPTITVTRCSTGIATVKVGSTYKLGVKAGKAKINYKSSKKKIASVSKKGEVKALKTGVSIITITAKLGKKTAKKKISVKVISKNKYVKVKKIKAPIKEYKLFVGDSTKAQIQFTPQKASNKNLLFSVDKSKVVTVTEKGQIKAKKEGDAKITVTSCENKKAKVVIKVSVSEESATTPVPTASGEPAEEEITERTKDSDGDGYPDYIEINYMGSDPYQATKPEDIPRKGIVTKDGVIEINLLDDSISESEYDKYYSENEESVSLVLPAEYESVEKGSILTVNYCNAYPQGASVIVEKIKKIGDSTVIVSGKKPKAEQVLDYININIGDTKQKNKKATTIPINIDKEDDFNIKYPKTEEDEHVGFQIDGNVHMDSVSGHVIGYREPNYILGVSVYSFNVTDLVLDSTGNYSISLGLNFTSEGAKEKKIPIPILGPVKFAFGIKIELEVNLSLKFVSSYDIHLEYHKEKEKPLDGSKFVLNNLIPDAQLEFDASLDIKVFADFEISPFDFEIISIGAEIGPKGEFSVTQRFNPVMTCVDLSIDIELNLFVRTDMSFLSDWFDIDTDHTWHLWTRSFVDEHYENGKKVDECTYGKNNGGSNGENGGKYKGFGDAPGLYDQEGNLKKTWDDLVNDGDITVDGTTITKSKTTNIDGNLRISDKITGIENGAFRSCKLLTGVVIPGTISDVGGYSFDNNGGVFDYCINLKKAYIEEGVSTLGNFAFCDCEALDYVYLPNGLVTVGSSCFKRCNSLTELYLPESVINISTGGSFESGQYLFQGVGSVYYPGDPFNIKDRTRLDEWERKMAYIQEHGKEEVSKLGYYGNFGAYEFIGFYKGGRPQPQ